MNKLDWLVGQCFQSIAKREYDWTLSFENGASVRIECLWRLIEKGHIVVTSNDDGHKFGLPAPVDAAGAVNSRLYGVPVEQVALREGTLDLTMHFNTGHLLQIVPDSSGYEAWEIGCGDRRYIAVGGGSLAIFEDETGEGKIFQS